MTNLLEQGAKILHSSMVAHAGVRITYTRAGQSKSIDAVPGRVPVSVYDERGSLLRSVVRDFIVNREDLAEFDPPTPVRNDEIVATIGGRAERFMVNGDNIAVSHYEEADSYGVAWRIHTKRDGYA